MADAFLSFSFLSSMHHTPFVLFSSFLLGSFILIMGTQFTHQYLISFFNFFFHTNRQFLYSTNQPMQKLLHKTKKKNYSIFRLI